MVGAAFGKVDIQSKYVYIIQNTIDKRKNVDEYCSDPRLCGVAIGSKQATTFLTGMVSNAYI